MGCITNTAHDYMYHYRNVMVSAVSDKYHGVDALKRFPSATCDREIVLAAVKTNGHALKHASEPLKDDREIVLAAVLQIGGALMHASDALRGDREIVLAAVQNKARGIGLALKFASESLRGDHEVVLAAVKHNGMCLHYASDLCKKNREIVRASEHQIVTSVC